MRKSLTTSFFQFVTQSWNFLTNKPIAKDPSKAFKEIAAKLAYKRKADPSKGVTATTNVADASIVYNMMMRYIQGGKIAVPPFPINYDDQYILPLSAVNMFSNLFESEWYLHEDHPYKLLRRVQWMLETREEDITDELRQEAAQCTSKFLRGLWAEMKKQHDVTVTEDPDLLNPEYKIKLDGHMIACETAEVEDLARGDAEIISQAARFAEMQKYSTVYRAKFRKSLDDFLADKNGDPNANGLALAERLTKKRAREDGSSRPKVSVLGLGPSGIATAIESFLQGADVVAIEARESYSRNNTFRIPEEFMNELFKLFVDDPEDIKNLPEEHPIRVMMQKLEILKGIETQEDWGRDWDRFYQIAIKDFEDMTRVVLDVLAKHSDGVEVLSGYKYEAGSAQTAQKTIQATKPGEEPRVIPTDYVVDTTGLRGATLKETNIKREKMSSSSAYCTFTYHLPRGPDGIAIDYDGKLNPEDSQDPSELAKLGWTGEQPPVSRFFITGDHPYIGVDLPPTLWDFHEKQNKIIKQLKKDAQHAKPKERQAKLLQAKEVQEAMEERMQEWARATLKKHLTEEAIDALVPKSIAAFETTLVRLEDSTFETPSGMQICYVGDSYSSAHFQTGAGAVYGIFQAREFAKFVGKVYKNKAVDKIGSALKAFKSNVEELAYKLHKRAFDFKMFTREDLKLKPTLKFREIEARLHPDNAKFREDQDLEAAVEASLKTQDRPDDNKPKRPKRS